MCFSGLNMRPLIIPGTPFFRILLYICILIYQCIYIHFERAHFEGKAFVVGTPPKYGLFYAITKEQLAMACTYL